ncbi:HlyD family efflux transporter periplasmic adaptor subunit [Lysobacter sp. F6437]|uniref:HlyD family efflux transporter periplasmic adaptor subunit n=1 Tax=Lysobacter sp. F6437 TaxID=3459296 RepID=UPI00403D999E
MRMGSLRHRLCVLLVASLCACAADAPQALGTLEYERIALPAPAAERIVAIEVREGERVEAGQLLLRLDDDGVGASTRALQAQAEGRRSALEELEAGPREEAIAQARARLAAVQAQAREASAYYARLRPLGERQLVAAADVDRARAVAADAGAQVRAAQAALDELEHGTRAEQVEQGEAALRAAQAQAAAQEAVLDKLEVVAPRAGRVDALPYELGDQAPVGAPLAILLVGDAPHARVYVPEPIRARVEVGDAVRVLIDGRGQPLEGRVRMIRGEPSFTPYYALIGEDAARLSYLAEIELTGQDARGLPAGLPVRVEFDAP